MSIHSVKRAQSHLTWDNSRSPVLRVASGDTIAFDCLDASNGQIHSSSTLDTLSTLQFSQLDQANGPVYVEGALPGDTLQIDVLSIDTADWGWSACISGFGLLADEFTTPTLKIWKLHKNRNPSQEGYGYAWFDEAKGIKVPLRPFAGIMGVASDEPGEHPTIPPYKTGGNIDTRHVVAGSTLYLPVKVEGALFSMGDGHAAQGDGEVCGTAIETPIAVTVRLTVIKNKPYVQTPHFITATGPIKEEYYCTTGVDPDLREATRDAVRQMIIFLHEEYGIEKSEAYMLCSVAGDLRMHEVVDMPNYLIGMMMPRSIFPKSQTAAPLRA